MIVLSIIAPRLLKATFQACSEHSIHLSPFLRLDYAGEKNPQQTVTFWTNPIILGLKALDKLMGKYEFFQQNPQYRYAILEFFVSTKIGVFLNDSFQLPPFAVYEAIKQQFGDKLGEQDVLVSALCTLVNTQQKMFVSNQQKFNEFAAQAQARIADLESRLKEKEKL